MPRLDEFLEHLSQSRLVSPEAVEPLRLNFAVEPASDAAVRFARLLVSKGLLTTYQANKLLNGRTRGFFLGPYRVLRRLGEGGMGKVYLAEHRTDHRRVAIKVLPPRKALEDEQVLRRFLREMELSKRVDHPNVARTIDVGQESGAHFMVMEFVPGDSLYNLVRGSHGGSGPMRVADAARYFLKVLDGLEAAHQAGLVHRDIKPSNLMITPEGDAKLLDLGLARATGEESPLTHPNAVIGTLDYASPEQLSDASRADRRSDLYSLGCTLYFALTGRPPFEGGDIVNKIFRHRMEEAEPVEQLARGVPQAFGAIIRKLMAKDPSERYQDCAELRRDLARWANPKLVHALLGAEADAAKAFRPPPPELDEDDLRISDEDSPRSAISVLRELGSAEVSSAPLYQPPPPPRPALVVPPSTGSLHAVERHLPKRPPPSNPDNRWILWFSLFAFTLGVVAILLITLLSK